MIVKAVRDVPHDQRENQVVEIKSVNNIELRPDRQNKKDGKMKVNPTMFMKKQGRLTHCRCAILGRAAVALATIHLGFE
jgi:hypothetical protein